MKMSEYRLIELYYTNKWDKKKREVLLSEFDEVFEGMDNFLSVRRWRRNNTIVFLGAWLAFHVGGKQIISRHLGLEQS